MSDAFKNYSNLISGINADNQFKDSAVRAVAETKSKADEMGKTIGEVKSFLSGQHGGRAFAKNIKPILKKRAERLAEKAKAELETRAQTLKQKIADRIFQAKQEAEQKLAQGRQAVQDRLNGDPSTDSSGEPANTDVKPPTQKETPGENEEPTEGESGANNDGYDDWDKPYEGDDAFDAWDTPWGGDTIAESRAGTFSNPIANSRANLQNPTAQDSQNPMEPRSEPPSYDDSISDTTTTKSSPEGEGGDEPEPPPRFEPTGGEGDGALSNESQMANVSTKATGAGSSTDATAQEALDKELADKMAREAGEKALAEGGEEAGLSIADAIPGLDVLSFIGGGILAAIEAHKQKKEEAVEEAGATGTPNQAVQIGVGGE